MVNVSLEYPHPPSSIDHCSHSVSHFGPQCIRADGDEFEAGNGTAVGALRSNGFIVQHFILIRFQPHELEALWTSSDLR